MESINTYNLEDIFRTRQWFYDFLGKSFYLEPNKDRLEAVDSLKIFKEFAKDEESPGASLMDKSLREIKEMTDKEFQGIGADYNRLFVGPGSLLAPPWESVYLSEEKIIFDEHTLLVREFYRTWGVKINRTNKEPDDHIGFQLEFMSVLSAKALEAIEKEDISRLKAIIDGQNKFLESHTLRWANQFLDILYRKSEQDFFKALALFSGEYLTMDKDLIEDLIKNIREDL